VENLGTTDLDNLRLGLFKPEVRRHQWDFGDAFFKSVPKLSAKQSMALGTAEFLSRKDESRLDLSDPGRLYVDVWVSNEEGIYLFNFDLP
jgi:hypothetical protein